MGHWHIPLAVPVRAGNGRDAASGAAGGSPSHAGCKNGGHRRQAHASAPWHMQDDSQGQLPHFDGHGLPRSPARTGKVPRRGGRKTQRIWARTPLLPQNRGLLGFEKQVATVAMSLVEAVVQRQGVANHTIHLHTVVKNASKRALCVSLGHTQLSVVLGSEHRVERLRDVCSG